ncbi:cob(I)alamin adenosyltransferase [Fervidobacterium changbaicum]|uniref:Corrinoid adenosyltransferase n=2 Tax=Fervidobacterium TaxID=2422 RepID=A0AAI8CKQ7_FERIS|nr:MULTISPECIES: cob(I)yrinic acid a,c-diamide adenosyltransferase [Fervidobacterium]AMW32222.1 cob(I)yrinic acid a,c-diamide adenosyltransferase [Fervidobacterium islandicum]QAV32443.1 ATP:cob(I)alamin adenosyltransferase [Fervidobacterium changbaicum]SDH19732.1 cob(I)alamin adenosyltransferase [Fervidobacterium changbaicum]
MSITTKTGDAGETSLANGERISKAAIRVETYGTVDELNSFLGLAKHFLPDNEREVVEQVQKDLFRLAAELAKGEKFVRLISEEDIELLTKHVHAYEEVVKLDSFVLPGETVPSAYLDVCRTVARRAERLVVKLSEKEGVRPEVIKYLNRLSDLLYIMARFVEGKHITRIRGSEL